MQIKPQVVEAVLFFNEHDICKEMLFPEFEAILDGVVNIPAFADEQMHVAYIMINSRLQISAAVFFHLDFNEDGSADKGWNLPLRNLADRTGRGPDLGAGPIRLACRSQCPISWHQMHLWEPEQRHFAQMKARIMRNQLGLLVEEEARQAVPAERLQMVAEDTWYTEPARESENWQAEKAEQEQRRKAAQLIKQQRVRIDSLERQRDADVAKLREAGAQQQAQMQEDIQQLQNSLAQQEDLNASLLGQLTAQAETFQKTREEMSQQLRALEKSSRAEADAARRLHKEIAQLQQSLARQEALNADLHGQLTTQTETFQKAREEMGRQLRALERNSRGEAAAARELFSSEMETQIAAAVAEYKEQVAIRDVELAYRNELDTQLQEEIEQLNERCSELAEHSGERTLEALSRLGVSFMAYHAGAGHLTIAVADIASYQQNPLAYVAAKCHVSEEQYRQWLAHLQQPSCVANLPCGKRCAMPLDKVEAPAHFVIGVSNCCARHQTHGQLRTGS